MYPTLGDAVSSFLDILVCCSCNFFFEAFFSRRSLLLGSHISVSHGCRFFVEPAILVCLRQLLPPASPGLAEQKGHSTCLVCPVTYVYARALRQVLDGLLIQALGHYH